MQSKIGWIDASRSITVFKVFSVFIFTLAKSLVTFKDKTTWRTYELLLFYNDIFEYMQNIMCMAPHGIYGPGT